MDTANSSEYSHDDNRSDTSTTHIILGTAEEDTDIIKYKIQADMNVKLLAIKVLGRHHRFQEILTIAIYQ